MFSRVKSSRTFVYFEAGTVSPVELRYWPSFNQTPRGILSGDARGSALCFLTRDCSSKTLSLKSGDAVKYEGDAGRIRAGTAGVSEFERSISGAAWICASVELDLDAVRPCRRPESCSHGDRLVRRNLLCTRHCRQVPDMEAGRACTDGLAMVKVPYWPSTDGHAEYIGQ